MSEPKSLLNKGVFVSLAVVAFSVFVCLIALNIGFFGNVLLVAIGFGAVILVHEFGHFIFAKICGIKVEAFSIGFPPVLAGVSRTEKGYRIRVLPLLFAKEGEPESGGFSFTIGKSAKAGETEYQLGVIPLGGFVKMLGQDDIGPVKSSDDPRSFANKPVILRMIVVAAGVVFNTISAIFGFMVVFLVGINLPPPVIGGVVPDSPAAQAGLKGGDEIIEIAGKKGNLDFSDIKIAAALSGENEKVRLKVRHQDGTVEDYVISAMKLLGGRMRVFGIEEPISLVISDVSDANMLLKNTGLLPGDRIRNVGGVDVQNQWEVEKIIENTIAPTVTVLAERARGAGKGALVESKIKLDLMPTDREVKSESDLANIYTMVPRLKLNAVDIGDAQREDKIALGVKPVDKGVALQKGDIILAVGDISNPTYKELREVVEKYEGKELAVKVLRSGPDGVEKEVTVTVVPKRQGGSDRVVIGVGVSLDAEHPVVAKTILVEGVPAALNIPRGAAITSVDGKAVSNFYDVIREIRRSAGHRVTVDYRLNEEVAGDVAVDVSAEKNFITVKSYFAEAIPFKPMERLYKAKGPIDAIGMGYKKTVTFIAQTYVTLKRLIGGLVSPKDLMGPVGIVAFSYRIVAHQPLVYYIYFLGLISACIAVFNFLPMPPLDGGLVVILLAEKIKGSALSEKVQGIIAYTGWALIGSLILYVTFNDIINNIFR
jgi:regulator of sigma E protease